MDPWPGPSEAQTSPRRRTHQPPPPAHERGLGGVPVPCPGQYAQPGAGPDLSMPVPMSTQAHQTQHSRPRPCLSHRQGARQQSRPSSLVPISAPKVEPLSSRRPPFRSRSSFPDRGTHSLASHPQTHNHPLPITLPERTASPFFPELSSSLSSTSSLSSSSSSSGSTICMDDEETSLSEPDLVFDPSKADPLTSGSLVSVPAGSRVKDFVGEGSANVVVGIELPEGTPIATRRFFEGKLLRLQKVSGNPEKKPYPYPIQYRFWRERVKPLFSEKDELVPIDLVHLGDGADKLLEDIDELLGRLDRAAESRMEGRDTGSLQGSEPRKLLGPDESHLPKRKTKFLGSRLARVEYGMVVDDMRVDEEDGIMIEMKPKWLLQSPSAPRDSLRCRTCAVRLHRRLLDPAYDSAYLPCPLLMASDDWEDRIGFVSQLLPEDKLDEWYVAPLMRWFKATPGHASGPKRLVAHLRSVQQQLDAGGPLAAGVDDEDFRLAMTLRDCSIFLRVLKRGDGQAPKVVARIADLDKKNSEAKTAYWRRTEEGLLAGGAYAGRYKVDARRGRIAPIRTGCLMEKRAAAGSAQWREFEVEGVEEGDHDRLITEDGLGRYIGLLGLA